MDVVSVSIGTVVLVSSSSARGNYVRVRHSDDSHTQYQHLTSVAVAQGEAVNTRSRIGEMGKTGVASGIHLHFETFNPGVTPDGYSKNACDPEPFMLRRGVDLRTGSTNAPVPIEFDLSEAPDMRLVRDSGTQVIYLVSPHNMEPVPDMDHYYALRAVFGDYTDLDSASVSRIRDAVLTNIINFAASMRGQGL